MNRWPEKSPIVLLAVLVAGGACAHPGRVDDKGCHRDARNDTRHCHAERVHPGINPQFDESRPPKAGDEGVLHGQVVSVTDGDTLKVKVQGVVMNFRLGEVDAPEFDQPYGANARSELMSIVRDRSVVLVPFDTDRYGRVVAHAWIGKLRINTELVRRGAAWFDSRYSQNESLYYAEDEARDARRGLWALPLAQRVEPWVWRARHHAPRPGA